MNEFTERLRELPLPVLASLFHTKWEHFERRHDRIHQAELRISQVEVVNPTNPMRTVRHPGYVLAVQSTASDHSQRKSEINQMIDNARGQIRDVIREKLEAL